MRKDTIEAKSRVNWKGREEGGFGSVHSSMQRPEPPDLESVIGERISSLCIIDMDTAGKVKELIWINGKVMRVRDGIWLVGANSRTKCFKSGEADEVLWYAVPEVNYPAASPTLKKFFRAFTPTSQVPSIPLITFPFIQINSLTLPTVSMSMIHKDEILSPMIYLR